MLITQDIVKRCHRKNGEQKRWFLEIFNRRIKDNSRNLITLYDELTRHIETDTKLASIVSKLQDEIEILKKK